MKKILAFLTFTILFGNVFLTFSQNSEWIRTVNPVETNDVCADDNDRQFSISYRDYQANFSFNGNQDKYEFFDKSNFKKI